MKQQDTHKISPEAKALASEHFGFSKKIARQAVSKHAYRVPFDDAVQAGALGLVAAAENFDPSRGIPFEAYARRRINGAILDYVRQESGMPRSLRIKAAELEVAEHQLAACSDQLLSYAEYEQALAEKVGMTVEQLRATRVDIAAARSSLNLGSPTETSSSDTPAGFIVVDSATNPETEFCYHEEVADVIAALGGLTERERKIIVLHYVNEVTLVDIADELGLSASRVGHLRTRALQKVRKILTSAAEKD